MGEEKQKQKKQYFGSDEVKLVAENVIKTQSSKLDPDISIAKIDYLLVEPEISPTTVAMCRRTSPLLKYYGEIDYVVEVSKATWDKLNDKTKNILILHELMHVKIGFAKNGTPKFGIKNHDITDFFLIIKEFGTDWLESIKSSVASIYDFTSCQEDNIKI